MDSQIQVILNASNMLSFTLYLFHLYELKVISLGVSVSELRSLCYIRQLYYCTTANQNKHINNPNILKSKSSLSLFFGVLCLLRFELVHSAWRVIQTGSLLATIQEFSQNIFFSPNSSSSWILNTSGYKILILNSDCCSILN